MAKDTSGRHAFWVGAGILLSRVIGLVRQRVFSHYFGLSDVADAFSSALRVPNLLQNLFGEGVLSASFIPVYAQLLAEDKAEEADQVAGAIGALLAVVVAILVCLGVYATPSLIWAIAPGYTGAKRELTILLVRILFPGTGLLVASAWCLGILNSHRKFFLSYSAPVIWNAAMIGAMLLFRRAPLPDLAVDLAFGTLLGCLLQFLVQLPPVLKLAKGLKFRPDVKSPPVRDVLKNFGGVVISRGVVQLSAYVDQMIASLLGAGAMAAMTTASTINMLPVSLFGMAVSAAELPAMSGALSGDAATAHAALRTRIDAGGRRIAFFVVPSAMAFFALGDVITAALYQSGRFGRSDALYVWAIIAGSGVGLLATTLGRLYASAYYALRDTKTPLGFAVIRVALTIGLGLLCALVLPPIFGLEARWGAVGLTASAGVAGWIEFVLLRRTLNARIGQTGLPVSLTVKLWGAAGIAAAAAWAVKLNLPPLGPIVSAAAIVGAYGVGYFAVTLIAGVEECRSLAGGVVRRLSRRR